MSGVLINHVIEQFGLIGAQQGYMTSMINIGTTAAILSTFVFRWKYQKTTMLIVSILLSALMLALTGFSTTFSMLLIVSLALGVGLGWTDTYANSCVIDADREGSAKNQSALQGWYGIGAIIAPILVSALLLKNNWQEIYLILVPIILVPLIIYIFTMRFTSRHISFSGMESKKLTKAEILSFIKEKKSIWLLVTCVAYYTMQYGLFAWLVRYMNVQYGEESLGMASITVMWVFTAVARFLVPRLPVDNLKFHTYGALIAGAALFIGIFSGNPWMMCVMVGLGAFTTGNSLPTLMNRIVVTYNGGSLMPTSAMLLAMQITGMITPPILGWVSVYSMQGSMVIPAAGGVISGLLGFVVLRILR